MYIYIYIYISITNLALSTFCLIKIYLDSCKISLTPKKIAESRTGMAAVSTKSHFL